MVTLITESKNMHQGLSLFDIDLWRKELGLLPVPLFTEQERSFVLLNGNRGNFCLDIGGDLIEKDGRNIAWSSNVGHFVALSENYVEVQRWDQKRSSLEKYNAKSVYENLEKFHAYLEQDSPRKDITVIAHAIQVFRKLRAAVGNEFDGLNSLKAFLYLLGCAADNTDRKKLLLEQWGLDEKNTELALIIQDSDWNALLNDLLRGRPLESLVPNITLVLRHASGQLFQEAHYEAIFVSRNQLRFGGILPAPAKISNEAKGVGLHFTPPALARTLVEEVLSNYNYKKELLVIFDPACGSGEFLRESLRQLKIRRYDGKIQLIGWDDSESACDMAKFALTWEKREFPGNVSLQISRKNSLDPKQDWPRDVDIVLMNPPFVSWEDMNSTQKELLHEVLGNLIQKRPDLSYAFLLKSISCLRNGGVLGTILPSSFLDGESARKIRQHIGEQMSPILIARLGSHTLFSNATVDASFYVAKKGILRDHPATAFWADYRSASSSAGLRALRKIRQLQNQNVYPVIGDGFSIYVNPSLGHGDSSWAPRPYKSWKLTQSLDHLPKVEDLFQVKQGIRTGHNKAFILPQDEWAKLLKREQRFFRPAIVNRSVQYGFLKKSSYVFYPYGEYEIENENELRKNLGEYYREYLLPNKNKLMKRPRVDPAKWWQLTWHRDWQVEHKPKIISTSFGGAGSFAWDESGDFVVVQGWAWLPIYNQRSQSFQRKISLAYLAILNSPFFAELLSAFSNHVSGGQWDLSSKFVSNVALPDLLDGKVKSATIDELSNIGMKIHQGLPVDEQTTEKLINSLYELEGRY